MKDSIIGNYYDLLNFFRSGNYHGLERYFRLTLNNYCNLSFQKEDVSLNRRRAIRYLNSIGLLEIDYQKPSIPWTTCPGFLFFKPPTKLMCIGGTILTSEFLKKSSKLDVSLKDTGYRPKNLPPNINFFPKLPEAKASFEVAKELAETLNVKLIESPSESVLALLPTIEDIANKLILKIDDLILEEGVEVLKNNGFMTMSDDDFMQANIFRKLRHDGRYDYFVRASLKNKGQLFRLLNNDWVSLVGHYLIERPIEAYYYRKKQSLEVPKNIMLPGLLERCLVGCSFTSPSFNFDGKRIYVEVPEKIIKLVQNKISILEIRSVQ